MIIKNSTFISTRRHFLKSVIPAGTLFCLGCNNLLALPGLEGRQENPSKKHKFLEDSGMSFKEVYDFAFKNHSIPLLQNLEKEIGKDKFIEMLKEVSSEAARQNAQNQAKSLPKNDFAAFTAWSRDLNRFWKHVLTFDVVEDTDEAFEVKITECLWAKTFREMDAGDLGYATICHGDYAYAQGFNPKIRMIRTKTLMQGHDFCNHRYIWEA